MPSPRFPAARYPGHNRVMRTASRPWWKITSFLVLTGLFTWMLPWQRIPLPGGPAWGPGLAALVVQFVFERRLSGLGWRPGPLRWLGLALLLPLLCVGVSYATGWMLGLAPLRDDLGWVTDMLGNGFGLPAMSRWMQIAVFIASISALGLAMGMMAALGEEIGWRGLLVPAFFPLLGIRGTALTSGALWALWHWPGLFDGGSAGGTPQWHGVAMSSIALIAISVPIAWLTWRSRSLWPATLFHSAYFAAQGAFGPLTAQDGDVTWLVGGSGAPTAAVCVVLAVIVWRRMPPRRLHE
jgi:membrane protease YdiL (CAAX protease family)